MPYSGFVNATVRFGAVFRCRELYGAVRLYFMSDGAVRCGFPISYSKTYGAVRCGSQEGKNLTVCFGAVNRAEPHRTDMKNRTVKNPVKKARHTSNGVRHGVRQAAPTSARGAKKRNIRGICVPAQHFATYFTPCGEPAKLVL